MTPKRLLLVCGVVLLLAIFGFAWRMGGDDFSDGARAVANVGGLKRGMAMSRVVQSLHPERSRRASQMSYGVRPGAQGGYEMIHALTPTRYIVLSYEAAPSTSKSQEPVLRTWRLVEGLAPREDVTIGRALRIGPFRIRY